MAHLAGMRWSTLIGRSLSHNLRSHLGAILGSAVGTAVLVGALLVGESVRSSLREMALARLGRIEWAASSGDRLFREALANEVQSKWPAGVVPALGLVGTATLPDGSGRANQVQVLGVRPDFWKLANGAEAPPTLADGEVLLNERLASHLKLAKGDTLLLRVPKPSGLSADAPLAPEEDSSAALRLTVAGVVGAGQMGQFGLSAAQTPPFNAFVALESLQKRVDAPGKANLLLFATSPAGETPPDIGPFLQLEDAQLQVSLLPSGHGLELRTSRVFLDPVLAGAALKAHPNPQPIFTYFVNRLSRGAHATPYSMVAAAGAPYLPSDIAENEILLNQWLAADLEATAGDEIEISYYVVGLMRELVEKTNTFKVRSIVPMERPYADPSLMPDFPGLAGADNCRDWDTGFPIATDQIRDKDEKYWDDHKGTPKAFIALATGQALWGNRFGNLTSVRYPASAQGDMETLKRGILASIKPADIGLALDPARARALAASAQGQDFGQLFIGFSFFLIASALLLMSLLFRFNLELRTRELGTLLAVGFTPRQVRRLLVGEGAGLAIVGGVLGVFGGAWYAKGMLHGLGTIWRDAVGGTALGYHGDTRTMAIGALAGVAISILTLLWVLRREGKRPARELLAGDSGTDEPADGRSAARAARGLWIAAALALGALALAGIAFNSNNAASAGLFFGAGALLLAAGLFAGSAWLRKLEAGAQSAALSYPTLATRAVSRRRKRSLSTIALLACGFFLIASIGAFKLDAAKEGGRRDSGTGGFALYGESSLPVSHNLNAAAGRDFFGLSESDLQGVSFVPLRARMGEDASCLNLNRAQTPRVLGVDPGQLASRKAFANTSQLKGLRRNDPWNLLNETLPDGAIPAIGDANSIQWALDKKIGDTVAYTDGRGRTIQLRLVASVANSILQGGLLISEANFIQLFPSESGYRVFLVDAPPGSLETLVPKLTRALRDVGLELTRTVDRLNAFNAVQNTYLGTFQVLGGLGLLLGSVGLGVVLLRNVFERRAELGLLQALGYRRRALLGMILGEHSALLLGGLVLGLAAAGVAILPAALQAGQGFPASTLALTLGSVLASGLIWTWVAATLSLRGRLVDSIRIE